MADRSVPRRGRPTSREASPSLPRPRHAGDGAPTRRGPPAPPKGVMISHRNVVLDGGGLHCSMLDVEPVGFAVRCRTCRWRTSPSACRRTTWPCWAATRSPTCPDAGPDRGATRETCAARSCSGCRARAGEDLRRRAAPPSAADSGQEGPKFDEAVETAASPIAERLGARDAATAEQVDAGGSPSSRPPSPACAALVGLDAVEYDHRGDARRRSPPSSSRRPRGSACRCRRSTACRRAPVPMTWEPHRVKAGTVRRGLAGHARCCLAEDGEVVHAAAATCSSGYLERPGEDGGEALDRRTARLHCGDIGGVGRGGVPADRRPEEGSS